MWVSALGTGIGTFVAVRPREMLSWLRRAPQYENLPDNEPIELHDVENPFETTEKKVRAKLDMPSLASQKHKRRMTTHQFGNLVSVIFVSVALLIFGILGLNTFFGWPGWFPHRGHVPALSLDELRNGTYTARSMSIEWLADGHNGEFLQQTKNGFDTAVWGNKSSVRHVGPKSFSVNKDEDDHVIRSFTLNRQRTHAIVLTDGIKHWRHSSFALYWILDVESQKIEALSKDSLSIASWSPDGTSIAYVQDHDLYVYSLESRNTSRVTFDGGADVFNGIPDWVYEEEVFAGDSATWWSPSGSRLAYMRTNDSLVPKFPIPYFLSTGHDSDKAAAAAAYPEVTELKYPKPGFPNPVVELWVYTPRNEKAEKVDIPTSLDQPIISEVIWVGEQLVAKFMNRESDFLEVWVVDSETRQAKLTRSYSSKELGGAWFEVTHNSHAIGSSGYIDTIDVEGYNHLGFFSPADSSEPKILTNGHWEVDDSSIAVNLETKHVYFTASKLSSIEHTLYRVSLDHPENGVETVGFEGAGVYKASFSPDATYALVSYIAPDAPLSQRIISLPNNLETELKTWTIEDNTELKNLLASRNVLNDTTGGVRYGKVDVGDGIEVNYREILPTKFDPRKKHPLLFYNYGGPGSQMVQNQLQIDFERIYSEQHNAVVVTVDPRGTNKRGRHFRASVRDHLGEFEADDVIAVAKIWNQKKYIDESTTAIWGWSYGGFLTLKTLERDVDLAFKFGVAVAPVTDWSLYDSIYTERYMHTPAHNSDNYKATSISNVTNLGRHERFLVMHGTGDDNVHFQNTLTFLDKLDLAGIENYDVHIFPDSDHSIYFHNANTIVYDKIDNWLSKHQVHSRK